MSQPSVETPLTDSAGLRARKSPSRRPLLGHSHLGCVPSPPSTKKVGGGKNGLEMNAHRCSARRTCFPVLPHISQLPVTEMRKQPPSPAPCRGSGRNLRSFVQRGIWSFGCAGEGLSLLPTHRRLPRLHLLPQFNSPLGVRKTKNSGRRRLRVPALGSSQPWGKLIPNRPEPSHG